MIANRLKKVLSNQEHACTPQGRSGLRVHELAWIMLNSIPITDSEAVNVTAALLAPCGHFVLCESHSLKLAVLLRLSCRRTGDEFLA